MCVDSHLLHHNNLEIFSFIINVMLWSYQCGLVRCYVGPLGRNYSRISLLLCSQLVELFKYLVIFLKLQDSPGKSSPCLMISEKYSHAILEVWGAVAVTPELSVLEKASLCPWEVPPTSWVDVRVSVQLETIFTDSVEEQIRSQVHPTLAKLRRFLK